MKNPEMLCLGCMEELSHPGEICKKCGFDRTEYERRRSIRALPSYTILAGKYLLGRVLGEGGFGITYLAWDLNRECRVAIKEYFPGSLAARDTRSGREEELTVLTGEKTEYYRIGLKNFAEEGKNLLRFQELPGIVSVRDFFQDNGTAYLVMEYVEGVNLKQYMRMHYEQNGEEAPMSEQEVLQMMRPLFRALGEIHKAGIVHRDISPENIIRGQDGKITLIDFGAARAATGSETKSLTIMLKHGYAPPEQYQSHGKQGPWTDIYAICATMYHMLTGRLPIESIDRVFHDELPTVQTMNPAISGNVSQVIEKGMAIRWEERYQSVEEMQKILYPERIKSPTEKKPETVQQTTESEQPKTLERESSETIKNTTYSSRNGAVCETPKRKQMGMSEIFAAVVLAVIVVGGSVVDGNFLPGGYGAVGPFFLGLDLGLALVTGKTLLFSTVLSAGIAVFVGMLIFRLEKKYSKMNVYRMSTIFIPVGILIMAWVLLPGMRYMYISSYRVLYLDTTRLFVWLFTCCQGLAAWPWAYRAWHRENIKFYEVWCYSEAGIMVMLVIEMILKYLRGFR